MNFLEKLQKRWQLESLFQVFRVLVVFALTGFTVMFIKQPLLDWVLGSHETKWYVDIIYYAVVLPLYLTILVTYGFLFGQFGFFLAFTIKTGKGMKRLLMKIWTWIGRIKSDEPTQ